MEIKDLIEKIKTIKPAEIVALIKAWDRQTWIYIGMSIFAGILFLNFLFIPAWCKRPVLKQQSVDAEAQIFRLKGLNAKKPQMEAQKKEIQELVDGFQKKLFTHEEAVFVLGKISKIAQDAEVELLSSKPIEGTDVFPAPYAEKYEKFVYEISIEGSYHRIANFVSLLESNSQYFQIQSLGIEPQMEPEKMGKHIAEIKLMAVAHNISVPPKDVPHAAAR